MAAKVPDVGELNLLAMHRTTWGNTLRCHLYQNNVTPADATVIGSFTEATFSGYAYANILNWTIPATVGGRATTTADAITFTNSTGAVGNAIYGYYVTDSANNLLWAEKDPNAPIGINVTGDNYVITPKFAGSTEF